jgi:hypothetical protein
MKRWKDCLGMASVAPLFAGPLIEAAHGDELAKVMELVEADAHAAPPGNENPLDTAARTGVLARVKVFVEQGADLEVGTRRTSRVGLL